MFKLKKILNARNNAPEYEIWDLNNAVLGTPGNIYTLFDGMLNTSFYDPNKSGDFYVCTKAMDDISSERKQWCYRVTPDMIFETTVPSNYKFTVGQLVTLTEESNNCGYSSVAAGGDRETADGIIVGANEGDSNKVLVRLFCKG